MKNRSRLDIVTSILNICKDGSAKTRIMYQSFLSYTQLVNYLNYLMNHGMLEMKGDEYKTTKKGLQIIGLQEEIIRMIGKD